MLFRSTIVLIPSSALGLIRDKGNMLRNRINVQDYKECQDDIQVVSGIAEEIRDVLLDYQVGGDKTNITVVTLKSGRFDRSLNNK